MLCSTGSMKTWLAESFVDLFLIKKDFVEVLAWEVKILWGFFVNTA